MLSVSYCVWHELLFAEEMWMKLNMVQSSTYISQVIRGTEHQQLAFIKHTCIKLPYAFHGTRWSFVVIINRTTYSVPAVKCSLDWKDNQVLYHGETYTTVSRWRKTLHLMFWFWCNSHAEHSNSFSFKTGSLFRWAV